ncbi:zinc fingers and homeoboxes protein 1-like [Gadus chalcogrammus]|uniref:zinc fingers and homeoboxes protein 1-like n=1 Tax=Gadus chalcogrammus TaxID=1042646 RepID=UPI0024C4B7D9|nr:zinc fingers and homeoboxes protein 1-like [Gadus chalcogrammus]
MASRRKSTTPCMRAPQEVVAEDSDQEMQEEEEEEELGGEEEEELEEEQGGGEVMEPDLDPAEGGFECKYCPFRTSEVKQFTQHVDQQHPQVVLNASYVCLDCDFHTKRYDALLEHNVRQHPGEERFRRSMLRRHNHTVFQQSARGLGAGPEGAGPEGHGACRGSIALSKTPIMRAHRRRHTPKKFPAARPADDVIKVESDEEEEEEEEEEEDRENMEPPRLSPAPPPPPPPPRLVTATPLQLQHGLGGVLQIKAGVGGGVLPPGTLAQVLSALQSQQGGGGGGGHSQLLIPLSSIPTYNASMDNNVLLLSAYNRFPYPSVCEIVGLSSQTRFSEEQIKVWFSAQRLKHGVSWTPEEVEEARRKKFNGTVQGAGHQTITVIPAANGLQSLFQTCQLVGPPGLLLTQAPITLAVAQQPLAADAPAEPKRQASPPGGGGAPGPGADPLGAKPKKSKEQLAELKASYGRRQFATEAEIARLMRVTGLTKRAIKKWFSDTRYNQRNAKEHQGAVPGEAPPPDGPPGEPAPGEGGAGGGGGARADAPTAAAAGGVPAVTIVIDSSDDASDGSPASGPAASDPRVKFRHAFPDFTPQRFKEKTAEQRLALEASFLTSRTPSDEELSRLRAHTKLTRREVDAWFTERRKALEPDADPEGPPPGAASSSGRATPPAARKVLKKTPEQLHILKTAFVRSQWPTTEDYDAMATESGLPRSYIVNWFGDTRYAWKNSNLKWFYLYQSGKVEEALNGGPVKTQKKSRKRFRGWSRRTRRPYPCRRSPQPRPAPVKQGEAVLRDHYLLYGGLEEQQLDELASRSALGYQAVRDWFAEAGRLAEQGLAPFSPAPETQPQGKDQDREPGAQEEEEDEEEEEEEEEEESPPTTTELWEGPSTVFGTSSALTGSTDPCVGGWVMQRRRIQGQTPPPAAAAAQSWFDLYTGSEGSGTRTKGFRDQDPGPQGPGL